MIVYSHPFKVAKTLIFFVCLFFSNIDMIHNMMISQHLI